MEKVIYIPLDERPCNYSYPTLIGKMASDLEIVIPPREILSNKKEEANVDKIWSWIFQNIEGSNQAIFSLEMLIYGGLLPSRLHNLSVTELERRLLRLKELKEQNRELKLYVSNLIMRTPRYSSSDEEPDYYEEWGKEIFTIEYLRDKKERVGLTEKEIEELKKIEGVLPKEHLADYSERREKNLHITKKVLEYIKEGVIDFLVIPQDDSSEFGFTAKDQKEIYKIIEKERLQMKVYVYPGADEVGCTLLSRVYNNLKGKKLKIYPYFSSEIGKKIIPLYEDRPLIESLKSHILATNSILVNSYQEADFILAVNTPGKFMQEAWENENKDITYSSFRNMREFISKINFFIEEGKKVVIADSAFSNGGETELITLLDEEKILDKIKGYSGWNTNCNTLGTALSTGVFSYYSNDEEVIEENKLVHLLEDWAYQSIVRKKINDLFLPKYDLNYFDLKDKQMLVTNEILKNLLEIYKENIRNSFKDINIEEIKIFSPWNRMFEIGIELKIKKGLHK